MLRRSLIVVFVAALVVRPAVRLHAADREHLQMIADIRMLQEQTQQLQQMLGLLSETLKTVTAKLDEQSGINRKAFADQRLLIDTVSSDLRVVREKADETNVRLTSLAQEVEALRTPGTAMGAGPTPETSAGTTEPNAGAFPPPAAGAVGPGTSPQRLYDMAWADYASGQWNLAIEGFKAYLRAFPKSELADNAQYLIGDSYQLDGKFNEALDAYDQVIKNYPTGDKVPDAYYKRALVLERLGQQDKARQSYEYVVKNYPDSDAGRLAKQRLSRPGGN